MATLDDLTQDPRRAALLQPSPASLQALQNMDAATAMRNAPQTPGVPQRNVNLNSPGPIEMLRNGQPVQSPPIRGTAVGNPTSAEAMRGGQPVQSPPVRGTNMVNPTSAEAMRGAPLTQGAPFRGGVVNQPPTPGRPIATAAQVPAVAKPGVIGSLGKALPYVGAAVEGGLAVRDMTTPGMTTMDNVARAGEGVGRVAGGIAGAGLGFTGGGPIGALAGGTAGVLLPNMVAGMAGTELPSAHAQALRGPDTSIPMDATAVQDRQTAHGIISTIKDWNQRAGAAISDVATLPVRGVAGALDSALVRPMRAAGINQSYLSPMVNPASNANGQSMTPFYDQIRARDAQAAPAPTEKKPEGTWGAPPAPSVPLASPVAPTPLTQGAGVDRGHAYPSKAQTGTPISNLARNSKPKAAPGAVAAVAPAVLPATSSMPNPMEGVQYSVLASPGTDNNVHRKLATYKPGMTDEQIQASELANNDGKQPNPPGSYVVMKDGSVVYGDKAQEIIRNTELWSQANPQPQTPVEIIRGPQAGHPSKMLIGPMQKSVATSELGYSNEINSGSYHAATAQPEGFKKLISAMAQGAVDANNPYDAKARGDLQQQELQNEGTARHAAISAGPGYAGVAQRATEAGNRLEHDKEVSGKPVVVGGGQEPVFDNNGMYVGMRQVPGRLFDPKKQAWIDQPAPTSSQAPSTPQPWQITKLRADPKTAAAFDAKFGAGSAAKILGTK